MKNSRRWPILSILFILPVLLIPTTLPAKTPAFRIETAAEGLNHPWSMVFLPGHTGEPGGERLLISERPGRLLLLEAGGLREVQGIPNVAAIGQGGLLDIALSPEFASDSMVYLSFAEAGTGGYSTAVARGRLDITSPDRPKLENLTVIYRVLPRSEGGRHFGSRLVFDNDGYLYVTLGERGAMERARDTHDPAGTVLRLNPDGSIPEDNPFAENGIRPGEGAPEIWTTGHRNPQGMVIHPDTGEIWIHEHGPKGGDEINILRRGGDYGWPLLTWGIDYDGSIISYRQSAPGYEDPLLQWTPSIAPSGMAFYSGSAFPEWNGSLFVGALAGQHLRRVEFRRGEVFFEELLIQGTVGRIRDVRSGGDGYIWILTDEDNGALYRLVPVE